MCTFHMFLNHLLQSGELTQRWVLLHVKPNEGIGGLTAAAATGQNLVCTVDIEWISYTTLQPYQVENGEEQVLR